MCLAGLALQMLEWRDVLDMIVSALGNDAQSSIVLLEFLTVLPEEVTEGRKVSLSVRCLGCAMHIVPRWLAAFLWLETDMSFLHLGG